MLRKLFDMFRRRKDASTACFCPGCRADLCSTPGVTFTDEDRVHYHCTCGTESDWDFDLMAALPELRGKVLGCWCDPLPCHGHVLVRLANEGAGAI